MAIKLALMKTGENVISDIKEVVSEKNQVCAYNLNNPHTIKVNSGLVLVEQNLETKLESKDHEVEVSLTPWIILTEDKNIIVSLDSVIAIVNPIQSLTDLYEEKINLNNPEVIVD